MRFLPFAVIVFSAIAYADGPAYLQRIRTFHKLDDPSVPAALRAKPMTPPIGDFNTIATASDGAVWLGGSHGLLRSQPDDPDARDRWQYFAGRRYLQDDNVQALVADGSGVWVRTASGVAHIEMRPMTLEAKAATFEERVRARHDRYGMVADSALEVPGDLSTNRTQSSDNDGLWTAMYGAAQCFQYAVTKSPDAQARARRATEAVLFLEKVTGRSGFPARSYVKKGEVPPEDGVWHWTADGQYQWKGDTSSDEIVGHFYLYSIAWDLLPDEDLRARIAATARRIMDHFLANRFQLIDVTGQPTLWGKWSPEYFATAEGRPDSPLNAVELLSFLKATHHITGDPEYDRQYRRVAREMGYVQIAREQLKRREEINYSDEELALLAFYPLLVYEQEPGLASNYRDALEQWWQNIRREENPLWTFIYLTANPGAKQYVPAAVRTLVRIPMDLVSWTVTNSDRRDIEWDSGLDRFQKRQARTLLPPDERPVMKWNGNPFIVDGGNGGRSEDDGSFYLLPYWMGRYMGVLS